MQETFKEIPWREQRGRAGVARQVIAAAGLVEPRAEVGSHYHN